MNEEQVRKVFREELAHFMSQSKFTFQRPIQILDGNDITIASEHGTRIGTSATQKIAFFGKTPIVAFPSGYLVQPTGGGGSAADAVDQHARATINDMKYLLDNFGLSQA